MKKKLDFQDFKFNFGDRVKDLISGVKGTVTAKILYDSGLKSYRVSDGSLFGAHWILENDLEVLKIKSKNKGNKKK